MHLTFGSQTGTIYSYIVIVRYILERFKGEKNYTREYANEDMFLSHLRALLKNKGRGKIIVARVMKTTIDSI